MIPLNNLSKNSRDPNHPNLRRIRSFVRREGRMKKAQRDAWETLWPTYGLCSEPDGYLDLDAVFGRSAEKVLEIGFGNGDSLAEMAENAPEKDFIGIEVYETGVGSLLATIAKRHLSNVRLFCADALAILEKKIPDNSLSAVQIFFADPWPKVRHHKRRLVQIPFVHLVAKKLKREGTLHMATDWMDYAYHMMSVMTAMDGMENRAGSGKFIPRPDFRPLTKYEKRGLQLGHQTWDLFFRRRDL